MYDEAYLAECHLTYCSAASDRAWDDGKYFLAAYYIDIKLYWSVMFGTHGGY